VSASGVKMNVFSSTCVINDDNDSSSSLCLLAGAEAGTISVSIVSAGGSPASLSGLFAGLFRLVGCGVNRGVGLIVERGVGFTDGVLVGGYFNSVMAQLVIVPRSSDASSGESVGLNVLMGTGSASVGLDVGRLVRGGDVTAGTVSVGGGVLGAGVDEGGVVFGTDVGGGVAITGVLGLRVGEAVRTIFGS
jgi:hypothetical protein